MGTKVALPHCCWLSAMLKSVEGVLREHVRREFIAGIAQWGCWNPYNVCIHIIFRTPHVKIITWGIACSPGLKAGCRCAEALLQVPVMQAAAERLQHAPPARQPVAAVRLPKDCEASVVEVAQPPLATPAAVARLPLQHALPAPQLV
jgi:hypothetical protein